MEVTGVVEQAGSRQGPQGGTADDLREHLHGMWSSVAPRWGEHAEFIDARAALMTERMLELSAPQPGERVLELACGAGGLGLAAAERVAPGGEVVVSDVVPEMTSIAAARAGDLGLTNVSTTVLDLEQIDEPDATYDVVLCRDGLQFALDPGLAVGEIQRVLRPGGRVALAVWGPRARNPWLAVAFDAVSAEIGAPVPPPGIPGPFALEDAGVLSGLLAGAQLADVSVSEFPVPLRTGSFEEWWARTTSLAGPLAKRLSSLSEDSVRRLRDRAREAASSYETPVGLEFPGVALLAAARRP